MVKYFNNLMGGIPQLTNVFGALTALLDAVLVTGFNLKTLDSLTCTDGVATATVNSGHGYTVNQVVLITGASPSEYNGEHIVLSANASTFTFALAGSPTSPATGTIACKAAPLGFEIAYTGTNKRAYRSTQLTSNKPILRVDDSQAPDYASTYAKYAKVSIAQNMSDIDTYVGSHAPYDPTNPTKNEVATGTGSGIINGWYKWIYAHPYGAGMTADGGAGNRNFHLVGDSRGFVLSVSSDVTNPTLRRTYYFGDFNSLKSGDVFNYLLTATDDYNPAYSAVTVHPSSVTEFEYTQSYVGKQLATDYTNLGMPVRAGFVALNATSTAAWVSGYQYNTAPFPNGANNGLLLSPVAIREESGHVRGMLTGIYFIPHALPYSDGLILDNVNGRKMLLLSGSYSNNPTRFAVDLTGWERT